MDKADRENSLNKGLVRGYRVQTMFGNREWLRIHRVTAQEEKGKVQEGQ